MSAISPQDWKDQQDGAALRRLREALPDGVSYNLSGWGKHQVVEAWRIPMLGVKLGEWHAPTIAAAADACRVALEGKK